MKIVVSPDMVAHLWANQSQPGATNPGRTLYFERDTIYSYGSHFPIARHVASGKKKAILWNANSYSATTNSHQSKVRQAMTSEQWESRIEVDHICYYREESNKVHNSDQHQKNLKFYNEKIQELFEKAKRARKRAGRLMAESQSWYDMAIRYRNFYGIKASEFPVAKPDEKSISKHLKKQVEAAEKAEKIAQEKRKARQAECQAKADAWAENDEPEFIGYWDHITTRLKVLVDNDGGRELVTSRGARVPLDHAIKALPFIRAGREWHRNGQEIRVGLFHFDSIDAAGNVTAGCHTIDREEIERIARKLGV